MAYKARTASDLMVSRHKRVIVCEDLDFYWDEPDLIDLSRMWENGVAIDRMVEHFRRDGDDIFVALLHLARNEIITTRTGGLLYGL